MREIKFRAWTHDRGMVRPPFMLFVKDHMTMLMQDGGYFGYHGSSIELMQYTGLKDKNGVEIYEGDIFNLDDDMAPAVIEYTNSLDGTTPSSAEFCFSLYEHGECFQQLSLDEFYINKCEVIGNIYEHPHLLGGGQEAA